MKQISAFHDLGFRALATLGIAVRLIVSLAPGNQLGTRLGGGGDTNSYVRLASSLLSGKGLSYFGQPSAFRPPGYPMILAAAHLLAGHNYIVAVRVLQFAAGIVSASLCALLTADLGGRRAGKVCFVLYLFFPTLLYFTGEILTETFAALLTSVFLFCLARADKEQPANLGRLGIVSGLAPLLRFNMIFFPLVAAWSAFSSARNRLRWKPPLTVMALALFILTPWIVRNLIVFHGEVIYSTHTGMDLVEGLLRPQGRANIAQGLNIVAETGWSMQGLENNETARRQYPSEPVLNRMAMHAALRLWSHAGMNGLRVILQKLGYFWLSTDQLLDTGQLPFRVRLLRFFGVSVYWICLTLAILGLWALRKSMPALAASFLQYSLVATGIHLFFAMDTRLRVPLIDPLLCVLASLAIATKYLPPPCNGMPHPDSDEAAAP